MLPAHIIRFAPRVVGGLLLYAGLHKLGFPGEAVYALQAVSLKHWTATALIGLVTAVELYLGFSLLSGKDLRFTLPCTVLLFFCFTVFLWYLSTLAHPPGCGCLGLSKVFQSNKSAAVFGIFRNCLVLWLLCASYESRFLGTGGGAAPSDRRPAGPRAL
jgi:hypothetical protein